jgi:peroxiredoxin
MLLISTTLFAGEQPSQGLHPMPATPAAQPFQLSDMDGRQHRLEEFRGQVVVINFWATWCPPCREELPSMNRAYQQLKQQGVVFLAVNVGENEDVIFPFQANYPVEFPILLDLEGKVISQYGVIGLPTTFVIDRQGRLAYRAVGSREWDQPAMLQQIRSLLH